MIGTQEKFGMTNHDYHRQKLRQGRSSVRTQGRWHPSGDQTPWVLCTW